MSPRFVWYAILMSSIHFWKYLRCLNCLQVLYSLHKIVCHYNDVIMSAMASQYTSLTVVYSTVYSRRRSKKHQSFASLAFVRGIHRWSVNSPHKGPVKRSENDNTYQPIYQTMYSPLLITEIGLENNNFALAHYLIQCVIDLAYN